MLGGVMRYARGNAVAFAALFVALGGTGAYAVDEFTGANIEDETLTGADIRGANATATTPAVDGTIRGADIKDGALYGRDHAPNSLGGDVVADESLTGADVLTGSLRLSDLLSEDRDWLVHQSYGESTLIDIAQDKLVSPATANILLFGRKSGGGSGTFFGRLTLSCQANSMTLAYANYDGFSPAGPQRAFWEVAGSTARMEVLQVDEAVTLLSTTATAPTARHILLHVNSSARNASAVFDLFLSRLDGAAASHCYWSATEQSERR